MAQKSAHTIDTQFQKSQSQMTLIERKNSKESKQKLTTRNFAQKHQKGHLKSF